MSRISRSSLDPSTARSGLPERSRRAQRYSNTPVDERARPQHATRRARRVRRSRRRIRRRCRSCCMAPSASCRSPIRSGAPIRSCEELTCSSTKTIAGTPSVRSTTQPRRSKSRSGPRRRSCSSSRTIANRPKLSAGVIIPHELDPRADGAERPRDRLCAHQLHTTCGAMDVQATGRGGLAGRHDDIAVVRGHRRGTPSAMPREVHDRGCSAAFQLDVDRVCLRVERKPRRVEYDTSRVGIDQPGGLGRRDPSSSGGQAGSAIGRPRARLMTGRRKSSRPRWPAAHSRSLARGSLRNFRFPCSENRESKLSSFSL